MPRRSSSSSLATVSASIAAAKACTSNAGARGQVKAEDFRFGESPAVPPNALIPNRNYMNLLELPTLFYPACLMFYVTQRVDLAILVTSWAYVALRALHSAVHLTYNNVLHRLTVFALSNGALGVLWTLFFVHLGTRG